MAINSQPSANRSSPNRPAYTTSFIRKSHVILKAGYDRLNPSTYASSDEEDITGELTMSMQSALQDRDAPQWYKHFWAHEEVRVHNPNLKGKRRRRVDIEIIKSQSGKRPVLRFEAKRLRTGADVATYLGSSGLGCFLDRSYAADDDVVGMIGYVQNGSTFDHAESIAARLTESPEAFSTDREFGWTPCSLADGLETYRSRHGRRNSEPVVVLHTMLRFC